MRPRPLTALCLALLAGCASLPGDAPGKTILRIATWGGASEEDEFTRTIKRLWRDFEAENPGVEIREEKIPGSQEYVAKMLLSNVAGTEPDIMSLDASSAAVFINNNVLADLTPYIEQDPEFSLEDYWPNVVGIARRGSSLYAIPGDFTPMVVYYNKRLFDRAGVPYPKDDWTFDDFVRTARAVQTPQSGKGAKWGFKFDNWMPGWIIWVWAAGGDVLSPDGSKAAGYLDSPRTVAAVKFISDLVNRYGVAPSLSQVAAGGVNPFLNGDAAMEVAGHWEMVGIKNSTKLKVEDIGIAPWPSETGRKVTVMYEVGFAMSRRAKNPGLAWKLIKFLTSRRYQSVYQQTGIAVAARKDVARERAKGNQLEQKFLEIVPSARPPWGASVEGYDFVETEGPKMMNRVLNREVTPEQALREMVRRVDGYFKIK